MAQLIDGCFCLRTSGVECVDGLGLKVKELSFKYGGCHMCKHFLHLLKDLPYSCPRNETDTGVTADHKQIWRQGKAEY